MTSTLCFALLSGLLLLSACAHYHDPVAVKSNPAHTKIVTPGGTYDYHCPPGQRKKGRC